MNLVFFRNAHKISGAETYNLALLQELAKKKDLHISFVSDNSDLLKRIKLLGIQVYQLSVSIPEVGTKKEFFQALLVLPSLIASYMRLRAEIKKHGAIDVWVLQSRTEKLFLSPLLHLSGDTVVWLEHGPFFASSCSSIVKFLFKVVSGYASEIIAVSKDTKRDLVSGGIPAAKIKVMYIGVDAEKFHPVSSIGIAAARKRLRINVNVNVAGYLGTVSSEKGIEEFIQIAKALIDQGNTWHFLVIGDGPKLQWAKTEASSMGIAENFTFTGYVEKSERYLCAVDVLLFPTKHREGISMAILEAQAMGIPVLATDIGGNSEIITHGKNGYLYKLGDIDALKKYTSRTPRGERVVKFLQRGARKNVEERFDIRKQAQVFYEYFKQL